MRNKLLLIATLIMCAATINAQEANTVSRTSQRMDSLGIKLPEVPLPVGNYVPYKRVGNLVYINQIALKNGKIENPGIITTDLTEDEAREATRITILNIVAILQQVVGGNLDNVKQAVQITGIFNAPRGYIRHANIMNAGSNLLVDIFENRGIHTRATFGASSVPLGSPVEIQAIFEVE